MKEGARIRSHSHPAAGLGWSPGLFVFLPVLTDSHSPSWLGLSLKPLHSCFPAFPTQGRTYKQFCLQRVCAWELWNILVWLGRGTLNSYLLRLRFPGTFPGPPVSCSIPSEAGHLPQQPACSLCFRAILDKKLAASVNILPKASSLWVLLQPVEGCERAPSGPAWWKFGRWANGKLKEQFKGTYLTNTSLSICIQRKSTSGFMPFSKSKNRLCLEKAEKKPTV